MDETMPSPRSPPSTDHGMDSDYASTIIADSLSLMMEQECTTYACHDYFKTNNNHCFEQEPICREDKKITLDDRRKVVDWCYDIVDQCQLNRETVAVAMNMVDRFMYTPSLHQDKMLYHRGEYQLLIITALYLSIKTYESVSFPSDEFAGITRGAYSVDELEEMERTLLHGLEWRLCIPTPQTIGSQMIELLEVMIPDPQDETDFDTRALEGLVSQSTWDFIREEVAFQTQNSVRDYFFTLQRSSTVAAVSIMNAIEQVNDIEYDPLMKTLICILKMFDFVDARTLLYSRHRLRALIKGHEDDDDESSLSSCGSEERVPEDEEEVSYKEGETQDPLGCTVVHSCE